MNSEFGDISLFNHAFEADPDSPDLSEYLESVGLSRTEVEEVKAQFRVFGLAIRNAEETKLPDIPNPEKASTPARPSLN